ncbi:MAG: hypothetical protein MAG453_00653 [Calditrichaeota bacterium]|nr:hypothetical protein [Calditrichota bacterium]
MIALEFLYFVLAAAIMAAIGSALMLPPIRRADREMLFVRMVISFALKLVVGIGMLLLAWKAFGWTSIAAAFGMVGAYLAALLFIALVAGRTVKQMTRSHERAGNTTGDG